MNNNDRHNLPEILFISSYPPRECGIATYSQDLIKALHNKFNHSFETPVCALESEKEVHSYSDEVRYILDTSDSASFIQASKDINESPQIRIVMIQHEFGFFDAEHEQDFLKFLSDISKPVIITFHTVLPHPDETLRLKVNEITSRCSSVIVMTQNAADILITDYKISPDKISIIPHGVHLVPHSDKEALKSAYGISGRTILSTFGLIGRGKSIETTIEALPAIVKVNPDVLFLVIGKTHPNIIKQEGEIYRKTLEDRVEELKLQHHVKFINSYLPLEDLLGYLQLTDIYLFTSKDPNQAVSGTFSYAVSCGCPIISTPIPHAREVLRDDAGIIIDFQNSKQLGEAVNLLLKDEELRITFSNNGLQRIEPNSWENISLANADLFKKIDKHILLQFRLPELNLSHIKRLTTDFGMIQFSKINHPDISSGYTIDDNARALVSICMHFELTGEKEDLGYMAIYLDFIKFCQQPDGNFLNYVDEGKCFTDQNYQTNLEDSNGRTVWALGYLISRAALLPEAFILLAEEIIKRAIPQTERMHSTRAMAFSIKGLYYYNLHKQSTENIALIKIFAGRLVSMYQEIGEPKWEWFESYLTYGNSILPEAMLCAYLATDIQQYKEVAKSSFDFLLEKTFVENEIKVISNQEWLQRGQTAADFGEQPIDVAYTILALDKFYKVFKDGSYLHKMKMAFNWYLGSNHLHQIIYNPCTGGCYDGLEEYQVNLNQGAESTVTYLMARLTIEKYFDRRKTIVSAFSDNETENISN